MGSVRLIANGKYLRGRTWVGSLSCWLVPPRTVERTPADRAASTTLSRQGGRGPVVGSAARRDRDSDRELTTRVVIWRKWEIVFFT